MRKSTLIKVATQSILKNKMRTFLTMLGIVIGVAAVIVMVAVGYGAQSSIQKQIGSLGTNMIMVMPGASAAGRRESGRRHVQPPHARRMRRSSSARACCSRPSRRSCSRTRRSISRRATGARASRASPRTTRRFATGRSSPALVHGGRRARHAQGGGARRHGGEEPVSGRRCRRPAGADPQRAVHRDRRAHVERSERRRHGRGRHHYRALHDGAGAPERPRVHRPDHRQRLFAAGHSGGAGRDPRHHARVAPARRDGRRRLHHPQSG